MTSTERAAPAPRTGRPRKANRRQMLQVRIDPALRARLDAMAKEKGRTLTEQTETLLQHGVDRSAYPELAMAAGGEDDPAAQKVLALCDGLSFFFDRQIA